MIKFYPSVLKGNIEAPASKECALRMLFISAMASTPTKIKNLPDCKDLWTAIEGLKALGCKVETKKMKDSNRLIAVVEPFAKSVSLSKINFNFRDSATTARFLTVIATAYGIPANCQAEGTLLKRSQVSMTSRMAIRGITFSSFSFPLEVSGRLQGGDYTLSGEEGAEFVSALLTALPVLQNGSTIHIEGEQAENSIVQMTLNIIKKFGIVIEQTDDGFVIPGQQYYKSPKNLECENDWSLGTMWTVAAVAGEKSGSSINVSNLQKNSVQEYRDIKNDISILPYQIDSINFDAKYYPNIATLLCAIMAAKGATARITGVPQLKYKETDRLSEIGKALALLGANYESLNDGIIIKCDKKDYDENKPIDCMGDPWIFMSIALASSIMEKPITISDEHCVEKIYSEFLSEYKKLGGKYEIL